MEINKKENFICLSMKEAADMCRKADEEYYNLGLVRQLSKVNRTDLFLRVDIGYGDALKHRKSTGKYLRPYQWEDLTVDVYI